MRKLSVIAATLVAISMSPAANAGERTLTGVAIGAGAGAVVLGPVGAVAGGVVGAVVGGPRITRWKHRWAGRHHRKR